MSFTNIQTTGLAASRRSVTSKRSKTGSAGASTKAKGTKPSPKIAARTMRAPGSKANAKTTNKVKEHNNQSKPPFREGTKQARLIEMLRRPDGATIAELVKAIRWQAHSVRGAMSGALKKKLGLTIETQKVDGRGRIYRITN